MPDRTLDQLDSKFWKQLKKSAGIKSSGWFKKADASVGKYIEDLNSARAKFESDGMTKHLLAYQTALGKLADSFDKFISKKHLDEVEEGDLKKTEKDALAKDIKEWSDEIAAAKKSLDQRLATIVKTAGGDLKKVDQLDKDKKKQFWNTAGLGDTFNIDF